MGHEFDVRRPTGTSFKQPKGRQLRPPQMWTRGSVGSAPLGGGNQAGRSERGPTLHALGLAS